MLFRISAGASLKQGKGEWRLIKVSVITDEIGQDFERALDVALEHRVRHVELRGSVGTTRPILCPSRWPGPKELLDQRGMRVVAIAGPVFKCHLSEQLRGGAATPLATPKTRSIYRAPRHPRADL